MTAVTNKTKRRYIEFCRNPLPHRGDAEVAKEFDILCALPGVEAVAFSSEKTLLIGTSEIIINNPETNKNHRIGQFLIHLFRQRNGRVWDVMFGFENTHRLVCDFHHPHINNRDIPGIGNIGMLCIQRGHFHIYQYLRSGEMHYATKLLLEILNTYNPGGPYVDVSNWPRHRKKIGVSNG